MSFKLVGEVVIDARKGTTALKSIQGEATRTSKSFDNAGRSTKNLAKSLLQLGNAGGDASRSFMQLARLGTAGIIGAGAVGAINKFGEAVKNSATDYYETQKSLADAFETSFKSTSVEEARKGLEATADIADKLKGKITQLGTLGKIMGGLEKLTGINLGFGDTEKELKTAQSQLVIQEEILKTRQRELAIATQLSEANLLTTKIYSRQRALLDATEGISSKNVELAQSQSREVQSRILDLEKEREALKSLADSEQNRLLITKNANALYQQQTLLITANGKLEKAKADEVKKAQGFSGGVLGATKAGNRTLETARTQRERQLKTENYKTAQSVAPTQRDREKLAAQQAAREMPSLAEQIQGGLNGIDPSQLAGASAANKFEKDRAFGPAMMGGITQGKLGEEQGSVSKETLSALRALVDLMKSGTVVK